MDHLNMIPDATHLCDDAFWDALDIFTGNIFASHNNCRKLVNHNWRFSDEMVKVLIASGAVIGGALECMEDGDRNGHLENLHLHKCNVILKF